MPLSSVTSRVEYSAGSNPASKYTLASIALK